ncbi:DNA cytosine methyltransferase [Salininema proteolyticum]|uniref:DNA (cytosine-5-)-methyltransferase n=1 Tax=Salininema proteolyticum TaxID=1607685 RepID=A0ABV8TTJ1_9ACTN
MRIGSLFSGTGGLDLGVEAALGASVAWFVENDPAARAVLTSRFPAKTPLYTDVRHVDWTGIESVDVLTGGFPCQDVSSLGAGAGLRPGTRSGLWASFAHAIRALSPSFVVVENVRRLLNATGTHPGTTPRDGDVGEHHGRGSAFGIVLADLDDLGYDAQWMCVRAADIGAPHNRDRVFILGSRRGADVSSAVAHAGDWLRRHHESASLAGRTAVEDLTGRSGSPTGYRGARRARWLGPYEPAIRLWEHVIGRSCPEPDTEGRAGRRLSARFVEWMLGFPSGHVTRVPDLSRREAFRLLGNSVVPLQSSYAVAALAGLATIQPRTVSNSSGR